MTAFGGRNAGDGVPYDFSVHFNVNWELLHFATAPLIYPLGLPVSISLTMVS